MAISQLNFTDNTLTVTFPDTIPTQCTFILIGNAYIKNIIDNIAQFKVIIHPSVLQQKIEIKVFAEGYDDNMINIGGTGNFAIQSYSDLEGDIHVSPISLSVLQAYYTNKISINYMMANFYTGFNLLFDTVFNIIVPELEKTNIDLFSTTQKITIEDMKSNILNKIFVSVDGAIENRHYESFRDNWIISDELFINYANDINTIPNLKY